MKAFPEAEGYAKSVTGGTVVKVTNLNDSGIGSLRAAVSIPNRIVVFDVAGYINLLSKLTINDNITIAGQTAFRNGGQGITLRKSPTNPFMSTMVNLTTGVKNGLWLKTGPDYAGVAHISCRNLDRPGWAYLSGGENGNSFDRYPSYLKQISIKLDALNPNVGEFWGWNNARNSLIKYEHQAHGVPSRDGTKFLFASDWDDTTLKADDFPPDWIIQIV